MKNLLLLYISIISSNHQNLVKKIIASKYLFNQDDFGGIDNRYEYFDYDENLTNLTNLIKIEDFLNKKKLINQLSSRFILKQTKLDMIEKYNAESIKPNFLKNIFENTDFDSYDF
jgi:hypothetical protein